MAVISPWNYPLAIPMAALIPVVLAGNTVLFKPSEYTPLVGKSIKEVFDKAGVPKGVLNILYGDGSVGKAIIKTPVKKIFFTGSSQTGKAIMKACADTLKPVVFELGGKDSMIVLKDANLKVAGEAAVWGSLFNAGQSCCSVEKIVDLLEIGYSDFIATDAIEIALGGNQMTQHPLALGVVIMSNHPLSHDVVCAHILNLHPEELPVLVKASQRGYGSLKLQDIHLDSEIPLEALKAKTSQRSTGFQRVEKVDGPFKVFSGEPYCIGGCHGIMLDWLYMLKDRNPTAFHLVMDAYPMRFFSHLKGWVKNL